MPFIIASLLGGLIEITATLAGRVMVALGIAAVTYTGMTSSLDWLQAQAVASFAGVGADVIGMLSHMKVGQFISLMSSSMVARSLINGVQGDTVKKWVTK